MLDQFAGFQRMFKTKRNTEENEDDMASRLQIEMEPVFWVARRGLVVRDSRTLSTFSEVSPLTIGYSSLWK